MRFMGESTAEDGPAEPGGAAPPEPAVLIWLPVVVMVIVACVDVVAGPGVGFLPLVSLGPAFAGLAGTWRRTLAIGVSALLLCAALAAYDNHLGERRGWTALASVAGVTAAGVVAAVMRERREAELAGVRTIAEVAQRVLLRPVPRTAGPYQAAVSYTSAAARARIGGDLYEVVASPHGIRIIVGDVQGKGLDAVETAAVVLGAFREAAHDEPDLVSLGAHLDRSVNRQLGGERFVTAVLVEMTSDDGAVVLNHGHPAPMLLRADGTVEFPEPPSYALPLGLSAHAAPGPEPFRIDFAPGDQMLLYTDGVSEARDANGTFYPLGERADLLAEPDPEQALQALRKDLIAHGGGRSHDDAAMLLLRHRTTQET